MLKKKGSQAVLSFVLIAASVLHFGAIRKNQDPVRRTQTDPISLKQKQEETKDGIKGAPSPTFEYYEKEDFLTRIPMKTALEEPAVSASEDSAVEDVTEVLPAEDRLESQGPSPEGMSAQEPELLEDADDDGWWMEDNPQES